VLGEQLKQMPGVRGVESTPNGILIFADNADGLLPDIVRASNPFGLRDLTITETSLETVFIRLTGRDLRE
jgi:ABC-2 type transport system ATP-binding protein